MPELPKLHSSKTAVRFLPPRSVIRFRVDPRDVPAKKAARRLHLAVAEFEAKLRELIARGFPGPDPTTGMYDLVAIDAWMDARHAPTEQSNLTDAASPRNAAEVFSERKARRVGQR